MQKIHLAFGVSILLSACSHAPVKTEIQPGQVAAPVAASVTHEGKFEVIPMIGNFKAKRAVFPNGLKLVFLKDTSSPTFAYQTWFNVGSRNEVVGKTGLAHLFEHLMFKGTKNHKEGEFDALLERAGEEGENAFTTTDHTTYLQELPKKELDLIVGLESDRMVNLIVNDESFKTEREVVQNERRLRKENSPEGQMYQNLFETAYTVNPYHWPVIGYEQDLNLMNAQDARDFYERYYSPDRATIVVVGDLDEDDLYDAVDKAYGKIPARRTPDNPITQEPEQTAQRRKRMSLNVEVQKLWMAYKIPESSSPETPVIEVIQGILAEGKNSRLDRALVDSGISTSISAGSLNLKDPGLFLIDTDLQKGKTTTLAEPIILRELERLKNNLVTQEELTRVMNVMDFHFYAGLVNTHGKATFIGQSESQLGSLEASLDLQNKIHGVTPEMIQAAAQKYFNTSGLTVIVATPKNPGGEK